MSAVDINNYLPFLAMLFGGGVGVTLVAQMLKKLFKAQAAHVIHIMVVAVSVAAAAAQYILQFHGKLPVDVLGVSTPVIYGVSQFVYKESSYVNSILAKIYSGNAPAQPAGVPATAELDAVDQTAAKAAQEPSAEFSV